MTIKVTRLTEKNAVVESEASTARPVVRRTVVVDMHPKDFASISDAAYLMGTTVEEYLLIAGVQHARRVRIDFAIPGDQAAYFAQAHHAAHKCIGDGEPEEQFPRRASALRSA